MLLQMEFKLQDNQAEKQEVIAALIITGVTSRDINPVLATL